MHFDANFRSCGTVDVTALLACTLNQTEDDWNAAAYRQQRFAVHRQTRTISLVFDDDFRHVGPTYLDKHEEFHLALNPIIQGISADRGYQGWMVRCIITELRAGGSIAPHADHGFSLSNSHRFHIPVLTNDDVRFTVGDETIHMAPGELWEINNRRVHSVRNEGATRRIHMILDWADPIDEANIHAYLAERQEHNRKRQLGIRTKYD